jgi:CBS domain containing-hemolysin-like protein
MTLLIIYVLVALLTSFLCSILEASLLTLSPSAIQTGKNRQYRWAFTLEKLKEDIDRPLAAILTLNTVAHTMGAAGAGAQYAKVFGDGTEALFAAALTVAVLIITEIIPKTLGARYALGLAPLTARILPFLIVALAPLVWFSKQLTKLITKGKPGHMPEHREELLAVAHLGHESGQLQAEETNFLRNMLQLNAITVSDIMTPRTVIFSLPQDMTLAEVSEAVADAPFSRIPVYQDTQDDITGFVLRSDVLLENVRSSGTGDLDKLVRPLPAAVSSCRLDRLFRRMVSEGHHMMLVVDEYGTIMGLLTLEDILETIFGFEIVDETDRIADLQAHARELWRKRMAKHVHSGGGDSPG